MAVAAAALAAAGAMAQTAASETVRVPVARPSLVILGDNQPEPEWREPTVARANEIILRDFPTMPPNDVEDAVEALRASLPPDWLAGTMRRFNYIPNPGHRPANSRRTDLRHRDLAHFLFDRWVDNAPETILAREFDCISTGEFDISVFMTLLAEAQAGMPEDVSGWRLAPAARRLGYMAQTNARAAWWACSRMVASGWAPRR